MEGLTWQRFGLVFLYGALGFNLTTKIVSKVHTVAHVVAYISELRSSEGSLDLSEPDKIISTMPLYEYECKKCGHRFEKILKFSDKPMKKCPDCGGAVEQLISAATVQFKGAGWYVTDYAKQGSTSSAKSSESEGGSKDTTKDKESKESTGSKDFKEAKKEEKPKTESSAKKQKKD